MSSAAATAVAFAIAAVLSFFVPRRARWLLVVAVLVLPIALETPRFVRAERHFAAESSRKSPFKPPPPFKWRLASPRLIAAVIEHVPSHDSISIANESLETGVIRWLAYSVAPRQVSEAPARWTIVFRETPAQAGLHPVHAWRFGRNWLVER